jgi:DNA anti-recombination protein RmuC
MEELLKELLPEVKTMNNRLDKVDNRLSTIDTRLTALESKVEQNHEEVIERVDAIESNQELIKKFINNSDSTFRKSEEAYDFMQNIKGYFNKS